MRGQDHEDADVTEPTPEGIRIICVECGETFVFTPGEQQFFADKGFTAPKRCLGCRRYRHYGPKGPGSRALAPIRWVGR